MSQMRTHGILLGTSPRHWFLNSTRNLANILKRHHHIFYVPKGSSCFCKTLRDFKVSNFPLSKIHSANSVCVGKGGSKQGFLKEAEWVGPWGMKAPQEINVKPNDGHSFLFSPLFPCCSTVGGTSSSSLIIIFILSTTEMAESFLMLGWI